MKYNRNKVDIGHYMSKTNIHLRDDNVKIAFGDEFDITDVLKNNQVEILYHQKNYIFNMDVLDGAIIALSH
ncbi:hypothetical protein [Candidatus Colwellia aromaticivorans]|uniref:hypothetical protein n=1 Tax=Candidatus Colwellia aromaticivorans TaxID=2267621 RepID=UPI000DF44DF9|nr:hypothetical protein [Candidatus Colwellia aromaticivorans]